MLGPDQDVSDFPVWALPYIDIAKLSHANINDGTTFRLPSAVVNAYVSALLSAVSIHQVADHLTDKGLAQQFNNAASNAIAEEIDDICGTPPHPFPWPHHYLALEVAAQIATAAAGTNNQHTKTQLGKIATKLSERAREIGANAGITNIRTPSGMVNQ
jgi:hypothetical protein